MTDIHLVRQPVFDRADTAVGYELRFRAPEGDDGDPFARSYLSGSFEFVRAGLPAYVRATREQLLERIFDAPEADSLVVLLPPDLPAEPEVLEAVADLSKRGVTVVLDEFELPRVAGAPILSYLALANAVRIDLRTQDPAALAPLVAALKRQGKRAIADHVLDLKLYQACATLGFDEFQGPHFSRPEPLPSAELPGSTAAALRLLALARNPDTPERDLEQVISSDPGITFQLLRIVNSAALGGRGITSIGHALRMVGRTNVVRWLALASATARTGKRGTDDELVRQAVQRAHFCEKLATPQTRLDKGTLFLIGLFSLLDAVFRMPMHEVLDRVKLDDDVRAALLDRTGPFSGPLLVVESY
ncbi:MAG: HDOD domain-containing protein [Gemmatimonadetes bacterium]|nr:HDOD domain-containing protein [Gemmatimonadota bacterium]MCC6771336.1 HDOD domain-containing protein [Gemmatimonadaceae bacterium]